MADGDCVELPWVTALTVAVVVVSTLLTPLVTDISSGSKDEGPLEVDNVTLAGPTALERADFGAGTYHFGKITIQLEGVRGTGTVIIQIGVPRLDRFVLTWEKPVVESRKTDKIIVYQPSIEFHPDDIDREQYQAQVTVRIRSDGTSQKIATRQLNIVVERDG